jgi:hypothetical protein
MRQLAAVLAALVLTSVAAAQSDSCAAPTPIQGWGSTPFTTVGATSDGIVQTGCGGGQPYRDVWFCWTAPASGIAEASLCGTATFDTVMAVYAGCECPAAGSALGCNDDSAGCACASGCGSGTAAYASKVQFAASAGQQYLIRIGAYSSASTAVGTGALAMAPVPPLAEFTNPANGHRYIAVAATTWTAAEAFAVQLGGHLVSIGDQAENDWVLQNFGNLLGVDRRLWIGFTDQASEGTWAWSDGTPAAFTNWNAGEPNNSSNTEHYAEMLGSNGRWNDLNDAGATYPHLAVIELGPSTPPCPADFNRDGAVNGDDLGSLLNAWAQEVPAYDLDGDGIVDGNDLGQLLGAWGPCPG